MAAMMPQDRLDWDDTFGIVQSLRRSHPQVNFEELSLAMLYNWIVALVEFDNDPSLVNDEILMLIFNEWYEEVNT